MSRARGLRGLGSLRMKLRKLPDDLKKEVAETFEAGALEIRNEMLARVPRDSGNLANNITHKLSSDGFSAKIGFRGKKANKNAFYARFQEHGTVNHPPQPFMVPAFEATAPKVLKDLQRNMNKALRKAALRRFTGLD